jgi:hypothetical protein
MRRTRALFLRAAAAVAVLLLTFLVKAGAAILHAAVDLVTVRRGVNSRLFIANSFGVRVHRRKREVCVNVAMTPNYPSACGGDR